MKTKKNNNLDLKKATVVDLDESSMKHIKGGETINAPTYVGLSCNLPC